MYLDVIYVVSETVLSLTQNLPASVGNRKVGIECSGLLTEETTVQHVYYIELNREMGLLLSAGKGGGANIHRYAGGRVYSKHLDQKDRFS